MKDKSQYILCLITIPKPTRYGRDDEELLGLRFCNEVVVAADQIHPPPDREEIKKEQKIADDSDENTLKKSNSDTKSSPKLIEASVKPTNQRVHPTVNFECNYYDIKFIFKY